MTQIKSLLQWQTLEFEPRNISRSFYLWSGAFLLAIIIYALATNSPVMAITFILIGIMGYITLEKNPTMLRCAITKDGVIVDRDLYAFDNIESFWIVYEENDQYISLKTNGKLTPFVHIPLGEENPVTVREILMEYAQEEKHAPTIIDTIGKLLHIK
jgi:hypothetical protein